MAEVPEHLLARSRARRAALGQGGEAAPAAAGTPGESAGAAPAETPTETAPVPVAAPVVEKAAPPAPPYVQAGLDRRKIPWWVLSVLAFLPVWAVLYIGSLSEAKVGEESQLEHGGTLYAEQCAGCHGATGGGGTGPALSGGAVLETFPNRADQLLWVYGGSQAWPSETYGAQDKPVAGGMPGFGANLTPEELFLIVRYEREVLSGEDVTAGGATLGEGDELLIDGESGLIHYFGEAAEGAGPGEYEVGSDSQPVITDAEHSG